MRKNLIVGLTVASLFILIFVTTNIAVPIIKNWVIIVFGVVAIGLQLMILKSTDTKTKRLQGIVLIALTALVAVFKYIS